MPRTDSTELLNSYFAQKSKHNPAIDALHLLRTSAERGMSFTDGMLEHSVRVLDDACFDVEDFAENFLDAHLYLADLSEFDTKAGAPVFGIANPEQRTIQICTRATEYQPLFRATVLHEAAHLVLHRSGTGTAAYAYSPRSKRRPPYEIEADELMAGLILPHPILYLAVCLACHGYGMPFGEPFTRANSPRGRWIWRWRLLPWLINRLCVSRELILVTLSKLGKIDNDTYKYHLTYVIPNQWWNPQPTPFSNAVRGAQAGCL